MRGGVTVVTWHNGAAAGRSRQGGELTPDNVTEITHDGKIRHIRYTHRCGGWLNADVWGQNDSCARCRGATTSLRRRSARTARSTSRTLSASTVSASSGES